jgi:hypothetical protein
MKISEGEWDNLHRIIFDLVDGLPECKYNVGGFCYIHNYGSECPVERARVIIEEDYPEWQTW